MGLPIRGAFGDLIGLSIDCVIREVVYSFVSIHIVSLIYGS